MNVFQEGYVMSLPDELVIVLVFARRKTKGLYRKLFYYEQLYVSAWIVILIMKKKEYNKKNKIYKRE